MILYFCGINLLVMSQSTKLKQQGPRLTAFFYAFLATLCLDCYGSVIVSKLDISSGLLDQWDSSGINRTRMSNCWFMGNVNSYVETTTPIDLSLFGDVNITLNIGTFNGYSSATTQLQISNDGSAWQDLNQFKHYTNENSKVFSIDLGKPYLDYHSARFRLRSINPSGEAGAKLYSILVSGTPKPFSFTSNSTITDLLSTHYVAHWNKISHATNYEFSLYNMLPGSESKQLFNERFDEVGISSNDALDEQLSSLLPAWDGQNVYCYPTQDYSGSFLKIGNTKDGGYIQLPALDLSANNGTFELSFDTGSGKFCEIVLSVNGEKSVVEVEKTLGQPTSHRSFIFHNGTESTNIRLSVPRKSKSSFVLDNVVVNQLCSGIEKMKEGYPKILGDVDSYAVDELSPNTTYYYKIRPTNSYVTSTKAIEGSVKTPLASQLVVKRGEQKEFADEVLIGDLQIHEGASISGKVKVRGEVSYMCELKPNCWHSISLPFVPVNVGGYVQGKPYALRANYDYILQSYQDQSFSSVPLGKGGYIIKVLANIDDSKLIFFSGKDVTLNAERSFKLLPQGYVHLENPYTYPILPSKLVYADAYYIFKNGKFVLSEDELLPFQSFIAYNGDKGSNARSIEIDSEVTGIYPELSSELIIRQGEGIIHLEGITSTVRVYSIQGVLLYSNCGESIYDISLPSGVYLVSVNGGNHKVFLN